jgi:hypothetical protein
MAFKHWRSSAGIMLIKIELLIIYELLISTKKFFQIAITGVGLYPNALEKTFPQRTQWSCEGDPHLKQFFFDCQ